MDVDRTSWGSTLVKNHEENKTFILVKLSESFANAIQEYSQAHHHHPPPPNHHHHPPHQQQQQQHHHNHQNQIGSSHANNQNHLINGGGSTITVNNQHNNKRAKLHHNTNNYNNSSNNHAIINRDAPTIKFQGTRGAIKFPNGKSYDFSLGQSDNTVECIRQTRNKWETVGKMACCLHVKGKDDVYQRTRTKMEAAEQEKRKYCTKLLEPDIIDVKQLEKYKADLKKDRREFKDLHRYLQKIQDKFKDLYALLKRSDDGSPEWEAAKEQIFHEYERFNSDSQFHKKRSKYKQLRDKMAHIEKKIHQFNERQQRDGKQLINNNNNNSNHNNIQKNNIHKSKKRK